MSIIYTCATCKQAFSGTPAMSNGAGKFCASCDSVRRERMIQGTRARYAALGDDCLYCGAKGPHGTKDKPTRVCKRCDDGRDWLLSCIRHSDKVVEYVTKTETKEKDARQARQAEEARLRLQAADTAVPAQQEPDTKTQTRLDRLEAMLEKLTSALGGV